METQKNSGEMFSFPELEFGSPDSPINDPNMNNNSSPADHLFVNGRLLPHVFPIQNATYNSGTTRRSSSVSSSKDSWMSWSPSNSTNSSSRSSSCSSARTSSSDNSERRLFYNNPNKIPIKTTTTIATRDRNCQANRHVLLSSASQAAYGSSKRWQFITPAPPLNPEFPRRKKVAVEIAVKDDLRTKKEVKDRTSKNSGFGQRFFRSFLFACRDCHAMAPSTREDVL